MLEAGLGGRVWHVVWQHDSTLTFRRYGVRVLVPLVAFILSTEILYGGKHIADVYNETFCPKGIYIQEYTIFLDFIANYGYQTDNITLCYFWR